MIRVVVSIDTVQNKLVVHSLSPGNTYNIPGDIAGETKESTHLSLMQLMDSAILCGRGLGQEVTAAATACPHRGERRVPPLASVRALATNLWSRHVGEHLR